MWERKPVKSICCKLSRVRYSQLKTEDLDVFYTLRHVASCLLKHIQGVNLQHAGVSCCCDHRVIVIIAGEDSVLVEPLPGKSPKSLLYCGDLARKIGTDDDPTPPASRDSVRDVIVNAVG